jgi:NADP-dependent 3-hydroxy acid dehydrogenase YdfG
MSNRRASSRPLALVTGAGSGVGRATTLRLLQAGWDVAASGRRAETLRETAALAPAARRARLHLLPCDLADPAAIVRLAARAERITGRLDALVNAAGHNIPQRSLEVLTPEDYRAVMAANIDGVLRLVQAVLPRMRHAGQGTIVNVGSEAGRQASAKSGAAYVISKFGLTGLTQTINAEERDRGIRACCVFPGDIDTALLTKRPSPPPPEARARMLRAEDVAECIWFALSLPARANVEEILVRPSRPWTG